MSWLTYLLRPIYPFFARDGPLFGTLMQNTVLGSSTSGAQQYRRRTLLECGACVCDQWLIKFRYAQHTCALARLAATWVGYSVAYAIAEQRNVSLLSFVVSTWFMFYESLTLDCFVYFEYFLWLLRVWMSLPAQSLVWKESFLKWPQVGRWNLG